MENFTKSLLKFEKKLDSFNTAESTCQIASLEDLRGGLKLKLKKPAEEEDAGKVLTIHRVEG